MAKILNKPIPVDMGESEDGLDLLLQLQSQANLCIDASYPTPMEFGRFTTRQLFAAITTMATCPAAQVLSP
jgi:hypothetical protein